MAVPQAEREEKGEGTESRRDDARKRTRQEGRATLDDRESVGGTAREPRIEERQAYSAWFLGSSIGVLAS
jgi:hypothetical protein